MDSELLGFLPPPLRKVYERPTMHIHLESWDVILGYIAGYDAASGDVFLDGFREWAIPRLDRGWSLAWSALLRQLVSDSEPGRDEIRSALRVIAEFRRDVATSLGRRRVYFELERWLKSQSWHKDDSPDWIA